MSAKPTDEGYRTVSGTVFAVTATCTFPRGKVSPERATDEGDSTVIGTVFADCEKMVTAEGNWCYPKYQKRVPSPSGEGRTAKAVDGAE